MSVQPGPPMGDEGLRWEVFPNGVTFGILGVRYHGAIYAGRKEIASFSGDEEDVTALKAALAATEARGYRKARLDAAKEIAAEADAKNAAVSTPYDQGIANGMLRAANLIVRDLEATEGATG